MSNERDKARRLLHTADTLGTGSVPDGFDRNESIARFDRLAERLEVGFGRTGWTDPKATVRRRTNNQNTVSVDYFEIPADVVGAQHSVRVRVSNYFPVAMYYINNWIEGRYEDVDDQLREETQGTIEEALTEFGYEAVKPNSVLFEPYDGPRERILKAEINWFIRYFSYL